MMKETTIRVENINKVYKLYSNHGSRVKEALNPFSKKYHIDFHALRDVSFEVNKGETIGIIGKNGSGKSTLLQIITGVLHPTSGRVEVNGTISALLELGAGFNPEYTGLQNIYFNGTIMGYSKQEMDEKLDDILSFSDIGDFVYQPVKIYSSGMFVRLAFAVAINVNPEVLIVDEALAVGDAAFQRKCMRKIEELTTSGTTLLFVSHDTETVKKICSKAIYLKDGMVSSKGTAKDVCTEYERDLFGGSGGGTSETRVDDVPSDEDLMFLDPELLSSDEERYGDGRAVINSVSITTADHKPINVIPVGSTFKVSYKVSFSSEVSAPILGMMITNKEGICVFGTNTRDCSVSTKDYFSGDEIDVSFTLTNNLGPGVYYLTCGVHAHDHADGMVFLERRMDILLLRSLARDDENVSGISNLLPLIQTKVI